MMKTERYIMVKNQLFHVKKRTLLAIAECVWLRSSGLVPDTFIAVFYTGLGLALALAGVLFRVMFIKYRDCQE